MFFDVCDENLKVHDSDLLEHTVDTVITINGNIMACYVHGIVCCKECWFQKIILRIIVQKPLNYGSDAADDNFTESELVFYTRLANLAQYYMDNSTIDAYFVKSYNIYAINGVQYDDLGLTSTEAFYVGIIPCRINAVPFPVKLHLIPCMDF